MRVHAGDRSRGPRGGWSSVPASWSASDARPRRHGRREGQWQRHLARRHRHQSHPRSGRADPAGRRLRMREEDTDCVTGEKVLERRVLRDSNPIYPTPICLAGVHAQHGPEPGARRRAGRTPRSRGGPLPAAAVDEQLLERTVLAVLRGHADGRAKSSGCLAERRLWPSCSAPVPDPTDRHAARRRRLVPARLHRGQRSAPRARSAIRSRPPACRRRSSRRSPSARCAASRPRRSSATAWARRGSRPGYWPAATCVTGVTVCPVPPRGWRDHAPLPTVAQLRRGRSHVSGAPWVLLGAEVNVKPQTDVGRRRRSSPRSPPGLYGFCTPRLQARTRIAPASRGTARRGTPRPRRASPARAPQGRDGRRT